MTTRLQRIPLSVRLAAVVTGLFLVLLATVGTLVYLSVGQTLRVGVDEQLRQTAVGIRASLTGPDPRLDKAEDSLTRSGIAGQLVDHAGHVVDSSRSAPVSEPIVDQQALDRALGGQQVRLTIAGDPPLRVWVVPVDHHVVGAIIVTASLHEFAEEQRALSTAMVTAGLGATVLSALAGWAVARRSLAPVDRMTAQAAEIHAGDLTRRLPVPDSDDEIGRLGRTLNSMIARLSGAIERERAFTADASHELRTPLGILRAEVELARDRTTDSSLKPGLDSAIEEADRLSGLIDDLLVLARADADRVERVTPVDLGDLAAEVTDRFQVLAEARRIALTHRGGAVVRGDRRGLERAIANLVDNALRHTPEGGAVTVTVDAVDHGAHVTVSDTGPGVEEAMLGRLFDRFSRADPARTGGGAGLGLAIVAAVTDGHRGTLTARNVPGAGLEVVMRLG